MKLEKATTVREVLARELGLGPDEVLARRPAPELGEHMRQWRMAKGLSIRAAAADLGVPFSYLQKVETGGRAKPPTLALLQQVAAVYGVPTTNVLAAAGVRTHRVEDARSRVDQDFRRLVTHPELAPEGMDLPWLDAFSTKQKRQWIEFARRLQEAVREGSLDVDEVLATDDTEVTR